MMLQIHFKRFQTVLKTDVYFRKQPKKKKKKSGENVLKGHIIQNKLNVPNYFNADPEFNQHYSSRSVRKTFTSLMMQL